MVLSLPATTCVRITHTILNQIAPCTGECTDLISRIRHGIEWDQSIPDPKSLNLYGPPVGINCCPTSPIQKHARRVGDYVTPPERPSCFDVSLAGLEECMCLLLWDTHEQCLRCWRTHFTYRVLSASDLLGAFGIARYQIVEASPLGLPR